MKKIFTAISIAALLMSSMANLTNAKDKTTRQNENTIRQQKRELYKNPKALVKKEAQKLKKDGWKSMDLPLEKMIEITWEREILTDENDYPKYIYVTTQATASSYSAAQMEAQNVAKVRIAGTLSSTVASLTNIALENSEISAQQAESMSSAVEKAKVLVSGKLGRLITSLNIYKEGPEGYTVRNTVMYDMRQAIALMRDAVNKNLSESDRDNLGKVFGIEAMIDQYEKNNTEE